VRFPAVDRCITVTFARKYVNGVQDTNLPDKNNGRLCGVFAFEKAWWSENLNINRLDFGPRGYAVGSWLNLEVGGLPEHRAGIGRAASRDNKVDVFRLSL
jgi:hypothetical protein